MNIFRIGFKVIVNLNFFFEWKVNINGYIIDYGYRFFVEFKNEI